MSFILVFIPAVGGEAGFPTIKNLFPQLYDGSGLLFLRDAQRQVPGDKRTPEVVFVPEGEAVTTRENLLRALPAELPFAAAIHLGSGSQRPADIVNLLEDLERREEITLQCPFFPPFSRRTYYSQHHGSGDSHQRR